MKIQNAKKGYTLIEILVVVGVLGIIVIIGVNMFFSILKGSAKTRILTEVKQNGDYALEVMTRMIRNAKNLESHNSNWITITNPDGNTTTFLCSEKKIASEGASLISDKVEVDNCANVFSVVEGEPGIKPDVVTINFSLSQTGTAVRPEEEAVINFKTTVTLRNY